MKKQKDQPKTSGRLLALALLLLLIGGVLGGLAFAFTSLRSLWLEQSVITDIATQVKVDSGKMVKADAIREVLGLRNGVNLAEIDFAERRRQALEKYPTISAMTITRQLPDGVTITIEEREPEFRLGISGKRADTGRVVDREGVVFPCRRGTATLPILRERAPGTANGDRLGPRAAAALRLLLAVREPGLSQLGVQEVDVTKPDWLLVTLGDGSRAKIAWEGMDKEDRTDLPAMRTVLAQLACAVDQHLLNETKIWNATIPGTIFADEQGVH